MLRNNIAIDINSKQIDVSLTLYSYGKFFDIKFTPFLQLIVSKNLHFCSFSKQKYSRKGYQWTALKNIYGLCCIYLMACFQIAASLQQRVINKAIMVTASHNPPFYNGIKLQSLGEQDTFNVGQLEQVINSQIKFAQFVKKLSIIRSQKPVDFFIGRDTRPTSQRLSQILQQTLKILGNTVINLGQGSTPEILSISQFILGKITNKEVYDTQALIDEYFSLIDSSFSKAAEMISERTCRKWKKLKVYFDFSNGVGAISFKRYQFLNRYFDIKQANSQDFSHPNVNCGAQWIYHQRLNLPDFASFPQADHYVWFDGDSDRIIMKMKQENSLVQGEDFNACFIKLLKLLMQPFSQQLTLGCVGNINTNSGLFMYLNNQNIQHQQVPVGISNLFLAAVKWDACSFFQPNGHGSIYFSQRALQHINNYQSLWQAKFLLLIHSLSRNNRRGYALHDFLILELYLFLTNSKSALLFPKTYSIDQDYELLHPEKFINHSKGLKLLLQPKQLNIQLTKIIQTFPELVIKVRKSQTSPILRLTIQGQQNKCRQAFTILQKIILQFLKTISK